jgi:hypothetical protein
MPLCDFHCTHAAVGEKIFFAP